jgi:hypothetical protein
VIVWWLALGNVRYLFALCVAALIPLVVLLMAKRKVIVDLLRKKIKRVTNRFVALSLLLLIMSGRL